VDNKVKIRALIAAVTAFALVVGSVVPALAAAGRWG
jgi:hypothetical protein